MKRQLMQSSLYQKPNSMIALSGLIGIQGIRRADKKEEAMEVNREGKTSEPNRMQKDLEKKVTMKVEIAKEREMIDLKGHSVSEQDKEASMQRKNGMETGEEIEEEDNGRIQIVKREQNLKKCKANVIKKIIENDCLKRMNIILR
jgi:hypothetical protein